VTAPQRVLLAVLVVLALLAGGCGVPEDEEASPINPDGLPFRPTPDDLEDEPATSGPITEVVYFFDGRAQRLVPVERSVPSHNSVEDRIGALVAGITQEEADTGLVTFLAEGTALASAPEIVQDRVVVLDFNPAFTQGQANTDHLQAVAQVVWTVTDIDGIRAVLFERDGEVQNEVNGDGEQTTGPLDRGDFLDLRPVAPVTTTTTTAGAAGGD
jgi:spore germination protein GerM